MNYGKLTYKHLKLLLEIAEPIELVCDICAYNLGSMVEFRSYDRRFVVCNLCIDNYNEGEQQARQVNEN